MSTPQSDAAGADPREPTSTEVVRVDDPHDRRLRDFTHLTDVTLRQRREPAEGLFIAESTKVVQRALAAGHRLRSVLVSPRWLPEISDVVAAAHDHGAPVYVGENDLLAHVTGFHVHRGALASMHRPTMRALDDVLAGARRIVVLEDIADTTNIGAVFRSVAGLGADAVLISPRCGDPLYRRAIRVSMGTVFAVPWTRLSPWPSGLDLLRDRGFTVASLALAPDAVTLDDLACDPPDKLALVLGTEGDGLSRGALAGGDLTVRIPMAGGVDSLNVAGAAAVACWALRLPR